jgi:hypothetical protein
MNPFVGSKWDEIQFPVLCAGAWGRMYGTPQAPASSPANIRRSVAVPTATDIWHLYFMM